MSRLTLRDKYGKANPKKNINHQDLLEKLAHYEDLEEQGWLVELPCKVGDELYIPNEKFPAEVEEIRITPKEIFVEWVQFDKGFEEVEVWDEGNFEISELSKTVFRTKEETEARLEEIRKEELKGSKE